MGHPDCKNDDPQIDDEECLLRRIPPQQCPDGVITYDAFSDFKCSVEVASKSSPEECLSHHFPEGIKPKYSHKKFKRLLEKNWKVASIVSKVPRENDQTVYLEPIDIQIGEELFKNEAHAEICGEKSRALQYKLANSTTITLE